MKSKFKKGQKVRVVFSGIGGYKEESEAWVHSVKKGVVFICEEKDGGPNTGITYNAETGRELENFFPGMNKRIFPIDKSSQ